MEQAVVDVSGTSERLDAVGVRVARSEVVDGVEGVAGAVERIAAPAVVLKAAGLLHKTEDGGVVLGLTSPEDATEAARTMLARIGERGLPFLVQAELEGVEILVGVRRDPELGAAVVVGRGGTEAELHQDVARELVPVTREAAHAALRRLRCWPLLDGFRGAPPHDVEALVDVVVAVSDLAAADPTIVELDLNPVLVGGVGEGATAVDARIVTGAGRAAEPRPGLPPEPTRPARDLTRMMEPAHVAVVGVSDDEHKVGSRLFRYLVDHGYAGRLDPVHPSGGTVRGYDRAPSLADVEGSPDLVCVAVPARFVLDVARQAVDKQVGGVIVHSSDFAEVGEEGRAAQDELARILGDAGIPLAGPNDMGIVSPHSKLTASISGGLEEPLVAGNVALVTSSGALGSCVATRLMGAGIGLSRWIHAGNEADLVLADYLDFLVEDDTTEAVGILLEGLADGPRFVAAGQRLAEAGKPVFAFDMIRSERAVEAALSHTGAMVGSLALRADVLRASRMVSVPSLRVLEDALVLAATTPFPAGRRLMAVTFSGGACSIIADEAGSFGVDLPELPDSTRDQVAKYVPSYAAIRNPLDCSYQMLGAPDAFEKALLALVDSDRFDALLLQFTTNADPYAEHIARATVAVRDAVDIPVYVSRYGGAHLAPKALAVYAEAGVHVMDAPDRATQAIAAVMNGRHPEAHP